MSDLSGGKPVSVGGPLVVPVHLDALCLADDLDVRGPDNDFPRLPYRDTATGPDRNEDLPYLSEIMVRTPLQGPGGRPPIGDLTRSNAAALGVESLGSGDIARQMSETAERVTFLSS
ncbi:hypothetical protein ACFZC6_05555 [Streptomyces ossamyceticus]|uniref:Uncharacterized protein n=1 Tax=Streptomyces ossamyceticus TaxID=249581 RepID=A0ABV2UZA4_9ACTN